ncbi:MAG: hypothetical protein IM638_19610 [Bacteroidetes bacterium]|nr:hypothetical protein [Bacteroidota bacterium]
MDISFKILSRGSLQIHYGSKTTIISGELTFSPSVFYADLSSLNIWQAPHDKEMITPAEKNEIISFLSNQHEGTEIVFD